MHLPLADSLVPTRFGMITSVLVGIMLALATDRIRSRSLPHGRLARRTWAVVLAMALLPLLPVPLPYTSRLPVPTFVTSGQWREYVAEGRTLVPVPIPENANPDGMRWAAATNLEFALPRGYFLGPNNGHSGDKAAFGAPPSKTATLLAAVAATGAPAKITEEQRRHARDELRYWNAAIVVLPARHKSADALRRTVDSLLGPGQRVSDVWLWDVRYLEYRSAS
jgi:hypothetical protein